MKQYYLKFPLERSGGWGSGMQSLAIAALLLAAAVVSAGGHGAAMATPAAPRIEDSTLEDSTLEDSTEATVSYNPSSPPGGDACGDRFALSGVYSSATICQTGLTRPSLWWIQEQVGSQLGKKLVRDWRTLPSSNAAQDRVVVVVVNPQAWSLLDYFERYEFLNRFGLAAGDFGYQTQVQDSRGAELASYSCSDNSQRRSRCSIQFGGSSIGFRGHSRSLF